MTAALDIGSRATAIAEAHKQSARYGCVVAVFRTGRSWPEWNCDTLEHVPLVVQRDPETRFVFAGLTLMREE